VADYDLLADPLLAVSSADSGVWLYDIDGNVLAVLREGAIDSTRRFREHSDWSAKFPLAPMPGTDYDTNYDALKAAYFARIGGMSEVFLVDSLRLVTGKDGQYVEVIEAQSASALLSTRTIAGTKNWESMKAGAMIADMMDDFMDSRAIALSFGEGADVGSAFDLQRSWGDAGEVALEALAAQQLGMSTRFESGVVKLDVVAAADSGVMLGEKYKDGSSLRLVTDERSWRNYAYVLGEGEGAAREQVTVDQTNGAERRELYVDASDLQQGAMTLTAYRNQLAARGAAKLAETRRIEFAESSDVTAPLDPGDVIIHASLRWADSFMVTEVHTNIEGGKATHSVSLGDPPPKLKQSIRRLISSRTKG
jgi:hypothetical protein